MSNNDLPTLKNNLENLSMADLRRYASQNFGLKITRDHTKDDIVTLILGSAAKGNFAEAADGELKPGWARIKLSSTNDHRSSFPVHVNANGFECKIPFGVEVDVPIRVLESLRNAVEFRVGQNEFGERVHRYTDSYPFQVIAIAEGEDPRPGLEVSREQRLRPRYRFRDQFGFYPTDKTFRDFVQSGMFKLDPEEHRVTVKG